MADYSKTVIYKIEHNTNTLLVYVGHTTNYTRRKWEHGNGIKNKPDYPLYKQIIDNGGWESFTMKPIMEYPCENKIQAEIQEEKCRIEYKATMNIQKAYREDKTESWKKYEELHKEERKKSKHDYYIEHKEELKQYSHKFYVENRKQKMAENYQKNKEEFNAKRAIKYTCECGSTLRIGDKACHNKSIKHQMFLNT